MEQAMFDARKAADHALYLARHCWAVPVLHPQAEGAHRAAAQAYRDLADKIEAYAGSITFPPTPKK